MPFELSTKNAELLKFLLSNGGTSILLLVYEFPYAASVLSISTAQATVRNN